jgi:hypothetical protein
MGIWSSRAGFDFPPDIGTQAWKVAISTMKLRIPLIMRNTEKLLRDVTPEHSGFMKAMVSSWDPRISPNGSFSFAYGWKKTEWPGGVFYPIFVLGGTGIYGPRHTPIKPIRGPVLVWSDDEGNVYVKTTVKGQHPQDLFAACEGNVSELMTKEMNLAMLAGFKSIKSTRHVITVR